MKVREYIYRFASVNYLNKRIKHNVAKLNELSCTDNVEERLEIYCDSFDMMKAMLWKYRKDKTFVNSLHNALNDLIEKHS